jgi:uncharacterized protein
VIAPEIVLQPDDALQRHAQQLRERTGGGTIKARVVQSVRKRPLLFYFLMAFALSWAYEVVVFGLFFPQDSVVALLAAGGLTLVGPTLAAFVLTALTQGKPGIGRLLRRYVIWRVGLRWYLVTLLLTPALLLLGYLAVPGAIPALRAIPAPAFLQTYLVVFVLIFAFGGPLGEEPGWRGFALPRLQRGHGPLVGTLILGVLWGLWHLPLFILVPGYDGAGASFLGVLLPFLGFMIMATALAVFFTWVFNNVRGSLLLMMLLHATLNTATNASSLPALFPNLASGFFVQLMPILVAVVAALVIIIVTRGRLSYQRYQQGAELLDLPASMEQKPALLGPAG